MTAPLITVLITTYNYGQFLEQAIDSILSQDFPLDKIQIVVVDDGSTDDTPERVKKYGSRIEYFYKPNGGQASALNFGIAHAHGEIIALLDADDFFLRSKLSRIVEAFQRNPDVGMVYHPWRQWKTRIDEHQDSGHFLFSGNAFTAPEQFISYIPHPTSCVSFRLSFLDRLLPIPEQIRMLADGYLVELIPILSPILTIPESLSVYRIHGDNSYGPEDQQMPLEVRTSRLRARDIQFEAMRKWLADNGFTRKKAPVRSLLDRWTLYQERDEFVLNPPGRLRFFRHLLTYNSCYGPTMTRRLRITNHINAFGALVVGYKHFHLLDKWRLDATSLIKGTFKRPASPPVEK